MYMIAGLGNPGPRYKLTRHNVGFMVVDALANHLSCSIENDKFRAFWTKARILNDPKSSDTSEVVLVKPQTFMNLSGEAVQPLLTFFKINPNNLIVVHDEIDIPFGGLRVQKNRGHGGQNGVRNIHEKIGSDYHRVRVGVGRPTVPQMSVADHVLQNFNSDEMIRLPEVLGSACDSILEIIEKGSTHGT